MKCATHPEVETSLRCSKCDKPICPKCMVQTPVGARCRECARLYRLPTYTVSPRHYLQAIGAGLGMAVVVGFIWSLVRILLPFFLFNILLAAGVGYAIGEVVSLSVNRKRGIVLAVIVSLAVVLSYVVSILSPLGAVFRLLSTRTLFDLLALAVAIFVAVTRFRR